MKINENLTVKFTEVIPGHKKECFVYFTDKVEMPYFATRSELRLTTLIEGNKKQVVWRSPVNVKFLTNPIDVLDLPTGMIEIYKLWTEGNNIPDIATYWIAIKDGKAISIQGRTDMWRSEDYIYPNWLDSLRQKYSLVAA